MAQFTGKNNEKICFRYQLQIRTDGKTTAENGEKQWAKLI